MILNVCCLLILLEFSLFINNLALPSSSMNQTRIINGEVSRQGQWPFVAAIFQHGQLRCGGAVWNRDTVVTAAHCVVGTNKSTTLRSTFGFRIYLGFVNITEWNSDYVFKVRKFIVHPNYETDGYKNDIALIRLSRPINFARTNKRVSCVCHPHPLDSVDRNKCVTMGWGRTNYRSSQSLSPILLHVQLALLSPAECRSYRSYPFNTHWNVCARDGEKMGRDSCVGDSGGPLVCPLVREPRVYSLVGLTSHGPTKCGISRAPGFYTKVVNYVHWINKQAEED